jgi:hypothetical protein
MIAGYMGASGAFDDAIGEFAMEYADQNERDYRGFVTAIREVVSKRLPTSKPGLFSRERLQDIDQVPMRRVGQVAKLVDRMCVH